MSANQRLTKVKWFVNVNDDGTLFIDRKLLEGPRKIDDLAMRLVKKKRVKLGEKN